MKNFYSTITAHSSKITLQIFSFLLAFGCFQTAWAEGTKQVAPNSTDVTMLLTCHPNYSTFAGYNATANNRLYIHISNPATEQVYMGFSQQASVGSGTDGNLITTSYYFRVKDASGNIVYGPQLVNNTNANANTWALANAGPAPIVGASGYTPFTYTPAVGAAAGDYYIEFSDSPTANGTTAGIAIKFWDITVSPRTTPSALNGRVWSKNWAFRTPSVSQGSDPTYTIYDRVFNGQIYTYSDDGFVNKVNFANSGFRGLAFNIAFNQTGTANTGNIIADRKSVANVNSTNPQYRLFLNDPDLTVYPSGTIGSISTTPFVLNCPSSPTVCVAYATTQPGVVQILLDFNSASGAGIYDPGTADVLLYETVTPVGAEVAPYKRCVSWDGKNGLGATVSMTAVVPIYLTYFQGIVHFPMYDVEYNVNGYAVSSIRPTPSVGYVIKMKYDDSAIAAASGSGEAVSNVFTGLMQPAHKWTNYNFGNVNTINTWWSGNQSDAATAIVPQTPSCTFTGPSAVCASSTGNTHTGPASQDTYAWTISGSGTIVGSASGQSVSVTAGASGSYVLTLTTTKSTCTQTCSQTVTVGLTTAITGVSSTCINTSGLTFAGTAGLNSYAWTISGNGTISGAANAQNVTVNAGAAGSFTLNLTVTGNGGACTAMASQTVTVTASCAENKYLYLTDPSQGLDRIDPVATADGTTATSATLSNAAAGVVIDATSTNFSANPGSTSFSLAHTTGTGSNRLMLVGISDKNKLVNSVTYGGTPLTLVGENVSDGNAHMHLYMLLNPPSGTANVVVTLNANPDKGIVVGVTTFTGVNQTTPLGTFVSTSGSIITQTVNVTSAVGELVYDVATYRNATMSANSGQTELYNINTGNEIKGGGASTKPGAASVMMDWTASAKQDGALGAVSIKPAASVAAATFTQGTTMCSPLSIPAGSTITVTNYVSIATGTMPASPSITAVLQYGATTIITLSSPSYNSTTGLLTWTGTLGSAVTVPASSAISLTVTTAQSGVAFNILYDSQTKPSKITIPTSTYISISSVAVYSGSYPGGSVITNIPQTGSSYVRVTVTDPFGAYDINKVVLTLTDPSSGTTTATLTNPQIVGTTTCGNIYQYKWTNPATLGNWTIQGVAFEGTEGVTANASLPVTVVPQTGPVQASKQLYLSDPSQALDRVDPVNTADATTAQTATLSSGSTTTFTESPALCDTLILTSGETLGVTTYTSIISGSMPSTPSITAVVKYGSTIVATMSAPTYDAVAGTLTWAMILPSDVVIPSGQALVLQITTAQSGVSFKIDYDSQTKPSKIDLPTKTYIAIDNLAFYNAAYPGGTVVTAGTNGSPIYARAVVSDPFGFSDITALSIDITTPSGTTTTVAGTSVATAGCTRTYEYVYTPSVSGDYHIIATAKEGFENTVTAAAVASVAICPITVTATITNNPTCADPATGAINLAIAGGTAPFTYNWNNGTTTGTGMGTAITGLTLGTYNITVTAANGCTGTAVSTFATPQPPSLSKTSTNISCNGGANGTINLTVTGGVSPYIYYWQDGGTSKDRTGLFANTWSVTVTGANGCSATTSTTLTEPTAIKTIVAATQVSCNGNSNATITLTVSGGAGGYTYQWNDAVTTQNRTAIAAGTYNVTITDVNNCTNTEEIIISQPDALTASAAATAITCSAAGAITLTVGGGTSPFTYLWSNGKTTKNLTNLSAGTYTVTVTDAKNCTATTSATLSTPVCNLPPVAVNDYNSTLRNTPVSGSIATNDSDPDNTAAQLTYSLTGSVSAAQGVLMLSANGSYTFTPATNFTGTVTIPYKVCDPEPLCSNATLTIEVYIPVTDTVCLSSTMEMYSVTPDPQVTSYVWTVSSGVTIVSGQNTPSVKIDFSGSSAGYDSVCVKTVNVCGQSSTICRFIYKKQVTPTATANNACLGSNIQLTSSAVGGVTYAWSGPNSFTSNAQNPTIYNATALNTGTYTVTVTSANGCTGTATVNVTVGNPPSLATAVVNSACGTSTGAIDLTPTGGTSPYTFIWSNSATTEDISGLDPGAYTVTVTGANGCTATTVANVGNSDGPVVTATPTNVACNGGTTGSITIAVSSGTPAYTYLWSNSATTQNISGLAADSYSVTVTDALGCVGIASATLTQPNALFIDKLVTNVVCNGGTTGAIDVTVTGGTSPYTFNWGGGITSQNRSSLSAGTYNLTVTDALLCTATLSVTITQPTALSLSTVVTNLTCNGAANGLINLTVSDGTTPYSFSWTGGATTEDIFNKAAGTYTVTVTDANGCTATTSATLTEPAVLTATLSVSANVSCNGGNNGAVSLTVAGGTSPYVYNWSNGATTANISTLAAGIYNVTVTDAQGCTQTATETVTEPATLTATPSVTNASCNGTATGAINLTVAGGTSPYTFNWGGGITTQNRTAIAAGTYSITVTDAKGCTAISSVTVTEPSGVSIAPTVTNVACNGASTGAITLAVTGGTSPYTYDWGGGITTQNRSALAAGTYSVTVMDANNCPKTATITLSQPAALSLTTSLTAVSCNGGTNGAIDLTVSGGALVYTYLWSNGATTQDINSLAANTYTVTVTDGNGCTATKASTISQPTPLSISGVSTAVSCFGGADGSISSTVSGGTTPYIYLWSDGQTTANATALTAATYTVTVTDANNCTDTTSVTVTQPAAALASSAAVTPVSCFGGTNGTITLSVTGGTSAYTFNWGGGITTQNRTALAAGTYTVTITDAQNCTLTASFTVTQPAAALALSSIGTNVLCFGQSTGAVNLTPTGGTSPYTFLWSNGATTEDLSNIAAGTYSVTATDAKSCTATASTTITQPAAPLSLTNTVTNAACNGGTNGAIDLTVAGGTSPYTYSWSNGAVTQDISGLTAGNYAVVVMDANGCSTPLSIVVNEASSMSLTATTTNVNCVGGSTGAIDLSVTGGTAPYSYSWASGEMTQDLTNIAAGMYTVAVSDANNCVSFKSFTVTQPSGTALVLTSTATNAACNGGTNGTIDLTTTGGTSPFTFAWSNSATTEDISGVAVANYTVTVTDANGCIQIKTQTVNENGGLTLTATPTAAACNGGNSGSITLTVSGGSTPYAFNWGGGVTSQNRTAIPAATYTVTVTDAASCNAITSATVGQPTALTATTSSTQPSCPGTNGSVFANANGGTTPYTYLWSNGNTAQSQSGLSAATYTVTVTDAQNCTTTATATLTAPVCNPPVALNDTFSTPINTPITQTVATNDSDPDNTASELTFSPIDYPTAAQGTLVYNDILGNFTFTPALNFIGQISVRYSVCDPIGLCDTAFLVIKVKLTNDFPSANMDIVSTLEDTPIGISVLANDAFGGDGPSASAITITDNAKHGTATVNNGGTPNDPTDDTILYTPNTNYNGRDTLIYQICDANGDCDTAIVFININPVNDPPIAEADINNTFVNTPVSGQVLTNDRDPEGGLLTVNPVLVALPTHGTVVINPNGTYTYTPDPNFVGTDIFIYAVCDAGSPVLCDSATVTIKVIPIVTPQNDKPIANDDATQTPINTPVIIAVKANDIDPDGDPLSNPTPVTTPTNGTVTYNPDGTVTYVPNPGFVGLDKFKYAICDNGSPVKCDTATVFVDVLPPSGLLNNPPIAVDDANLTAKNTPVSGSVATNDHDPEGDGLTFTKQTNPTHGTVVFNPNGTYTYTPTANFVGTDQFIYTVCDSTGCDTATVYLTIYEPPMGTIMGTVFNDLSNDGLLNNGETGIGRSVYVKLVPKTGGVCGNTASIVVLSNAMTGTYQFTNVPTGDYCIVIDDNANSNDVTPAAPVNWGNTTPLSISNVTMTGAAIANQNFGLLFNCLPTPIKLDVKVQRQ